MVVKGHQMRKNVGDVFICHHFLSSVHLAKNFHVAKLPIWLTHHHIAMLAKLSDPQKLVLGIVSYLLYT